MIQEQECWSQRVGWMDDTNKRKQKKGNGFFNESFKK